MWRELQCHVKISFGHHVKCEGDGNGACEYFVENEFVVCFYSCHVEVVAVVVIITSIILLEEIEFKTKLKLPLLSTKTHVLMLLLPMFFLAISRTIHKTVTTRAT